MITAVGRKWKLHTIDITAAFLQGDKMDREVYLRPPEDICEVTKVWKLKRCIYGLKEVPRAWYKRVRREMLKLGGSLSKYDNAIYLWHSKTGELEGMLISHVDDFAFGGSEEWYAKVIRKIKLIFKISTSAQGTFKYVGINVVEKSDCIEIDQGTYIRNLETVKLTRERMQEINDELSKEEKMQLRTVSGQVLWVTGQTRPDAAYEGCVISNYGKKPTVRNLLEANKAVKKIQAQELTLRFLDLGNPEKMKVVCYTDATHASLPNGASQGAFIVFLAGENGKVAPVCWRSKKLCRVTKSPLASETLALSEGADAAFLVAASVQEIHQLSKRPDIECYTDNKSLYQHLNTTRITQDMRLRVDISRLREMVEEDEITVIWVDKNEQLADVMTKKGASASNLLKALETSVLKQ